MIKNFDEFTINESKTYVDDVLKKYKMHGAFENVNKGKIYFTFLDAEDSKVPGRDRQAFINEFSEYKDAFKLSQAKAGMFEDELTIDLKKMEEIIMKKIDINSMMYNEIVKMAQWMGYE